MRKLMTAGYVVRCVGPHGGKPALEPHGLSARGERKHQRMEQMCVGGQRTVCSRI